MPTTLETPEFLPAIHLNGTSAQMLCDDYLEAKQALDRFVEAFAKIEFNARDYYLRPGHWDAALTKRNEIKAQINSISQYLDSHLIHVSENL